MAGPILFLLAVLAQDSTSTVRRLIDELRSDQAPVREEARRRLKELGRSAAPELEKAAKDKDTEVAASVQPLLRALAIADRLPPRLVKGIPGIEHRLAADKHAWTTAFLELMEDWPDTVELDDLEALASPALREAADGAERRAVIEKIEAREFRAVLPDLVKLLDDRETLKEAAWALAEMDFRDAIPAIRRLLESSDDEILTRAMSCLQILDARQAIPDIRKLLAHDNPLVQGRAAETLGMLGDKEAAPRLMKLLHDEVSYVREQAVRALGFLHEDAAVPEIVPLLKDKDARMRGVAAMALGSLKAQDFAPNLLACLKDEDPDVRSWACYSLANLRIEAAIPALTDLLQDQPVQVRQAAMSSLVTLKATAAIPRIVPLLKEEDLNVSHHAARCLCLLGSREAVPVVLEGQAFLMDLSMLNLLRSPRRTRALGETPVAGPLEGTLPDLIRKLKEASKEPVELPALDLSRGPGRALLLRCDGSPTLLAAWESLAAKLKAPGPCEVIVDEDRIRILPRDQALAFWKAWHRDNK